ncbi:ExbD/TolR family protein [Sphingomonas sp. MMS24-J13]|uniref:ExbD/TolR family protein n=1 Tax=Sphingomonas sp. MMS24-J13 TaxID=3238686 RepID=UPI00384D49B9
MAMGSNDAAARPMMDINTTPLIDVMLVLLIMFIITIPLQSHKVQVDVPQVPSKQVDAVKNEVSVDHGGTIRWNGAPVNLTVLRQYLEQTQAMASIPELHVRPTADARYEVVDQVLAVAKRAHVNKMGFVDNDRYVAL